MVRDPARVRFTREMLSLIADAGLLEGDSYELLDGDIYEMAVESPLHSFLVEALAAAFRPFGHVREEKTMISGPDALKPDVALYDGTRDDFKRAYGTSPRFVIEVAVSTRTRDLGKKADSYARSGVPTYWVVDLVRETTVVHTHPSPTGYARTETVPFENDLTFEGVTVNLAALVA